MPRPGAGGPETYTQTAAPIQPAVGDLWNDGAGNLRVWTQTGWDPAAGVGATLSQAVSVLSQQVSVISQQVSVLSQQVSVISQQVSVISQQVSVLSQAHSVLSQAFSALSAGIGTVQQKVVSNTQTISGTVTVAISALSAVIAANGVYQIDGAILFNMSVADTVKFNLSGTTSAAVVAGGHFEVATGTSARVLENFQAFPWTVSATVATTSTFTAKIDAIIAASAAFTLQAFALASAAGNDINIKKGSYLRAYKVG